MGHELGVLSPLLYLGHPNSQYIKTEMKLLRLGGELQLF